MTLEKEEKATRKPIEIRTENDITLIGMANGPVLLDWHCKPEKEKDSNPRQKAVKYAAPKGHLNTLTVNDDRNGIDPNQWPMSFADIHAS